MSISNESVDKDIFPLSLQISLEDIDRKSEERTKGLLDLLGENKSVLQSISEAKRQRVGVSYEQAEEVVYKTASHLKKVEEVWLPRSKSCSPDKMDTRVLQRGNPGEFNIVTDCPQKLGSLDSIIGLCQPQHSSNNTKNISNSASIGDSDARENKAEGTSIASVDKEREITHTETRKLKFPYSIYETGVESLVGISLNSAKA